MSVLIKGMDMPKCCADCELTYPDEYRCVIDGSPISILSSERAYDCPLVEFSAEAKKGEWLDHYTDEDGRTVCGGVWCSVCGDGHGDEHWCGEEIKEYKYCPNCGAYMRGEE